MSDGVWWATEQRQGRLPGSPWSSYVGGMLLLFPETEKRKKPRLIGKDGEFSPEHSECRGLGAK